MLTVSRGNLLNGTLSALMSADDMELKKPLRVSCVPSVVMYIVHVMYMSCTCGYMYSTKSSL